MAQNLPPTHPKIPHEFLGICHRDPENAEKTGQTPPPGLSLRDLVGLPYWYLG